MGKKKRYGARHVWVKCKQCHKRFLASVVERRRGNARFCSRSCVISFNNQTRPRTGKTRYTYAESKKRFGRTFIINQVIGRIRGRAKKAGLPCDLSCEGFRNLWKQQEGRCAYTNRQMLFGVDTLMEKHMDSVSVDRVEPQRGYVDGNMVLCCRWVNTAKGQESLSALLKRAEDLLACQV